MKNDGLHLFPSPQKILVRHDSISSQIQIQVIFQKKEVQGKKGKAKN